MTEALPAPGTPIFGSPGDPFPLAAIGTLDPRNAMAEVMAAFLLNTKFVRGGGKVPSTEFQLNEVNPEWPDPDEDLRYPSATIIDTGPIPYEAHNLVPTALEETWGQFDNGCFEEDPGDREKRTVLWKTAEAVAEFQVDFWADDRATREAIAARIPSLFNPEEGRAGVVLQGEPRYFHRLVRATLVDSQRMDTPAAVYPNERRLKAVVRCEVDVVHLRAAKELHPKVTLAEGVEGE